MLETDILKAIEEAKNKGFTVFGIRSDDISYNVGDDLPKSRDYDDGVITGIILNGTCATGFDYLWMDGEQEDIDTVRKVLDINSQYGCEHQYLIGGTSSEYGNDDAEIIISDMFGASVIAVLR